MKPTSLDSAFFGSDVLQASASDAIATAPLKGRALRHALVEAPFGRAYDSMRGIVARLVAEGRVETVERAARHLDSLIKRSHAHLDTNVYHAAVMQLLAAALIEVDSCDDALGAAADALNLLAQEPRRKDEAFMQVFGALLYDLAGLQSMRGEYKAAERTIDKANRIFERLARIDPVRYGAAHIMSLNAATVIYRSRVKQVNMLAHYQVATSTYLNLVNSGIQDAMTRLVDSLGQEADTLMRMGKHRNAIQYYTRALKYLTKMDPDFSPRQLRLSIGLGEALLASKSSRHKGVHLLNTMLQKAVKADAADEIARINKLLEKASSSKFDIIGLWHKIFPR